MKKLLFLLFPLFAFGQKRVTGIFKPGTPFYSTSDFNKDYGLDPGDTVVIAGGFYEYIGLESAHDLIFTNDGIVNAYEIKFLQGVTNVRLSGKTVNGQKGIQVGGNKERFALGWTATGYLEISGVRVHDARIGIQVLTYPDKTYPLPYQNLWIHDCVVEDISYEGMYLGEYQTWLKAPAFISGIVENNIVRRTGNDGIQTRHGSFTVQYNILDSIGLGGGAWDGHGILIGGDTKNGNIKGNNLTHIAGYGVFINGFGKFFVTDNKLASGISGIFTKNFGQVGGASEDVQGVGFQSFDIQRNEINPGNGIAVQQYFLPGPSVASNVANNKTSGIIEVQPGVQLTQANNGSVVAPVPVPTAPKLLWTATKTINKVTRKYNVYDNGTWAWK